MLTVLFTLPLITLSLASPINENVKRQSTIAGPPVSQSATAASPFPTLEDYGTYTVYGTYGQYGYYSGSVEEKRDVEDLIGMVEAIKTKREKGAEAASARIKI